jgi:putative ABC transport system ATP-binding protein
MAISIRVDNVSHVYGKGDAQVQALTDVDMAADGGRLVAVVGPSGCGKSTLLSVIGQVQVPTRGRVVVNGEPAPGTDVGRTRLRNTTFGFVFQDFALVEQDTAVDNVQIPLRYARAHWSATARRCRAMDLLDAMGVADCAHRVVRLLSGGQRQRVALARALVNDPDIILADEPTGALDTRNGEVIFSLLRAQAGSGKLVIVVTHNLDLALECDGIVALRDGRVIDTDDAVPRRALRR